MFDIETLLKLIPALPLAAALVTAVLGKTVLKERSHWPVAIALVLAFLASLTLLYRVHEATHAMEAAHAEAGTDHAGADHAGTDHAAANHASKGPIGYEKIVNLWTWAAVDQAYVAPPAGTTAGFVHQPRAAAAPTDASFKIEIALRADPLTAIMLAMVTFVSSLVVIYASGYMHGDEGYWRFFTYVALFVFSMTMLVSVSNFLLLYVFWEAVGACSYLLIGFWFQKPEAAAAGKKAFLVNRIGDFGFALGVFLIWTTYGTLNFHDTLVEAPAAVSATTDAALPVGETPSEQVVPGIFGQTRLAGNASMYVGGGLGLAICLCLLTGACGKSAQFPLHVWLPDAMEGPTPVSALIHAATMVTAGVYLVARCTPLFFVSPEAQMVVASIGCFTALLAGLIALTQNDLKRVLAYSTVSQLGFMFLGLGTGSLFGITAGMFHLFTHAFFKALLFLGAGSVMHAMGGVIDMRRFGGLRHVMPWTHRTFWFGCLALAGVIPFAGFWSKDAILAAVHDKAHGEFGLYAVLYYAALFTAFLTAFYTFRALFMTFFGEQKIPHEAGHHAHESPPSMTVPLMILAVCALFVGVIGHSGHLFAHFLSLTPSLAFRPVSAAGLPDMHFDVAVISTVVALAGIGLAAFLYLGHRREVDYLGRVSEGLDRMRGLGGLLIGSPLKGSYALSHGKFFIDQIYYLFFVGPLKMLAGFSYWVDRHLIDGLVNFFGRVPVALGSLLRSLQTGMVQFYALAMVLGMLVLIGTLMWWPAV